MIRSQIGDKGGLFSFVRSQRSKTFHKRHLSSQLTACLLGLGLLVQLPSTAKAQAENGEKDKHWFVLEEFSTDSGFWHSLILDIDAGTRDASATKLERDFSLNGFAYTGPGVAPFGVAIEDGFDDLTVSRDLATQTVEVSPGQSRLADWLNDVGRDVDRTESVDRWTENRVLIDGYMENISNVSATSITYAADRLDLSVGKALIVEYLSEPFFYSHTRDGRSYSIQQRFRGLFVVDEALTETYYYAHEYSGNVDGEAYNGLQQGVLAGRYDYPEGSGLCGPTAATGGSEPGAVLSDSDLAQIESRAKSFRRVNLGVGQDGQRRLQHPAWFPGLFGATRSVHTSSSLLGERAVNPYPVVTIVPGAHMVDSGYVLGRSIVNGVLENPTSASIEDRDSLLYTVYGSGSPEERRIFQTDVNRTQAAVVFFDEDTRGRLPNDLVRVSPGRVDWDVPLASLDLDTQCALGRLGFASTAVFSSGKTYAEFSEDVGNINRGAENFRANFESLGEVAASTAAAGAGEVAGGASSGFSLGGTGTVIGGVAVAGGLAAGALALGGGGGGGGDDEDTGGTQAENGNGGGGGTEPPTGPTEPPTGPTEPPTGPTEPPTGPTEPPTGPTNPTPPVLETTCDDPADPDNPPSADVVFDFSGATSCEMDIVMNLIGDDRIVTPTFQLNLGGASLGPLTLINGGTESLGPVTLSGATQILSIVYEQCVFEEEEVEEGEGEEEGEEDFDPCDPVEEFSISANIELVPSGGSILSGDDIFEFSFDIGQPRTIEIGIVEEPREVPQ